MTFSWDVSIHVKRKGGEVRPCNDSEAVDEHIAGHDTIPESVLLRGVVFLHSPDEEEGCTSAIFGEENGRLRKARKGARSRLVAAR